MVYAHVSSLRIDQHRKRSRLRPRHGRSEVIEPHRAPYAENAWTICSSRATGTYAGCWQDSWRMTTTTARTKAASICRRTTPPIRSSTPLRESTVNRCSQG
jgi:hypothetical protein